MKMKFGAIVVDGRGKIGGHVASKNRGGAYLRTKVTPSNPNTSVQAAVRNRLTSLAQAWSGLTAAQRESWNKAVSNFAGTNIFADKVNPSGINLFTKLNANLLEVGSSMISSAPLPEEVVAVLTVSATAAAGTPAFSVAFTPTPVPAKTAFIIRATGQVSAGVSNLKGKFRNVTVLTFSATSPEDLLAAYTAKFGTLVAGQKIGVEIVPVNTVTGQKGQAVSTSLIVAA